MKKENYGLLVAVCLLGLAMVIGLSGCTDEKTVYVEKGRFEDPPPAAQGFLGYSDAAAKETVCGQCHLGHQAKWETTVHADAWNTLQASGHAASYCENCHTVGPLGNSTDGSVGWVGAKDERYHDVQCESCHGPGLNHVTDADASEPPQASVKVVFAAGVDTTGCAECHNGTHHPYAEEWAQSLHAEHNSHATSASCMPCHSAQGALAAWGVTADYLEKGYAGGDTLGITCAVCHDPHGGVNEGQLRWPINVPSVTNNLCMKCHNRRGQPETASKTRGPHAPEGPLLLGDAGYWPAGYEPTVDLVTTHGTSGNDRLCAACHVSSFTVNDPETGAFSFNATGHLFNAIPCLGEDGKPVPETECDVSERSFGACAASGCHGSATSARSAYVVAWNRIDALADRLEEILNLPGVKDTLNLTDKVYRLENGCNFNLSLARLPGTSTHNPFVAEQLLLASIQALNAKYGLSAPDGLRLERQIR